MGKDIEFKKGSDFRHLHAYSYDIFYVKNPSTQEKSASGEFGSQKVGAVYKSESTNEWEGFVYQSGAGLFPIDVWKEKIAREIYATSGERVQPQNINFQVLASGLDEPKVSFSPSQPKPSPDS